MLQWLRFLRSLPEYADGREVHLAIDSYSAHRCEAVMAVAKELSIKVHFIPPGLIDLLQPLSRSVFGALKAE
jgi:transposase